MDVEEEEEEEEDIFANDCISVLVFVLMSGFPFFFFLLTLRLSSKSALISFLISSGKAFNALGSISCSDDGRNDDDEDDVVDFAEDFALLKNVWIDLTALEMPKVKIAQPI